MAANDVSALERRTLDYITESMTLTYPPKEIWGKAGYKQQTAS